MDIEKDIRFIRKKKQRFMEENDMKGRKHKELNVCAINEF